MKLLGEDGNVKKSLPHTSDSLFGEREFVAGKLGSKEVKGDQVLLGNALIFTKENIEQYDF